MSETLFSRAQKTNPGGVNSPVRAFNGVGGEPVFIKQGKGAYIYDQKGNEYIDYVGSWGPMIVGHSHPEVVARVQEAVKHGMSFGMPTEVEVLLAEKICELVPSVDMVRMVNSGTEATMSAIRLARGYTGGRKIIKFIGCYHGHTDSLLVKAGSGLLTLGIPSSLGVPEDFVKHTLCVEYNDLEAVKQLFDEHGADIAAIILEPIVCNMNCVLPHREFLTGLRALCDKHQSLLIFDEVITGFRLGLAGAQGYYQITPDLTCFGKIIGGGMPVGAYGGRREIMEKLAPLGNVYQAGTLSGNPVAMTAGLATLEILSRPDTYKILSHNTSKLVLGFKELAQHHGIPLFTQQIESIFGLFFTDQNDIRNFQDVDHCNIEHYKLFFHAMLKNGVHLAPSAFECGFVSLMHDEKVISRSLAAADKAFSELAKNI